MWFWGVFFRHFFAVKMLLLVTNYLQANRSKRGYPKYHVFYSKKPFEKICKPKKISLADEFELFLFSLYDETGYFF